MIGHAVVAALRPRQSPPGMGMVQFYDGNSDRRFAYSIKQRVVVKRHDKVFVIAIRVWKTGRWRGEIMVRTTTMKAKHYSFLNFEAVKDWFRSEWRVDWDSDFQELTDWEYASDD